MPQILEQDQPGWGAAEAALKHDGITTAPACYADEADYLREAFIERSRDPGVPAAGIIPVAQERGERVGSPIWNYISLSDPVLAGLLLQPALLNLISSYYGRQAYFRRMPYVKRTAIRPEHDTDISSVYHIDQSTHFVGIMMLLCDLTEGQSHMRYLAGTHTIEQRDFRLKPTDPANRDLELALESRYRVVPLVGPKGTMFIYDNGNGIHRGNMIAGTVRDVMQATFSRGDHEPRPADRDLLPDAVRAAAAHAPEAVRTALKFVA